MTDTFIIMSVGQEQVLGYLVEETETDITLNYTTLLTFLPNNDTESTPVFSPIPLGLRYMDTSVGGGSVTTFQKAYSAITKIPKEKASAHEIYRSFETFWFNNKD